MSAALSFDNLERLVGHRTGEFRAICPICAPTRRTRQKSNLRVLKIWRAQPDFASFACGHCGIGGYAIREGAARIGARELDELRVQAQARQLEETASRVRRALEVWGEARPIIGTLAERYLTMRGIDVDALPVDMTQALRWHRACPWEQGTRPCMVALFTDAVTNEPRAIHRTAISPTAERIDRMALGPTAGCVIRLWPDERVEQGLVIGEGIETVLAAGTRIVHRGTLLQPAWACGFAGNLAAFPVLAGVESLTILVDRDESGKASEQPRNVLAGGLQLVERSPG